VKSQHNYGVDSLTRWTAQVLATHYQPWSPEVRCLDLLEEAGELARAVLLAERHKQQHGVAGEDMATAICGVLVDLLALADHYDVQLGVVYPQLLGALCADDDVGSPLGDVEQSS
jgi:NTP pyrophosphatase (non-canonical NTP hydrolase)